MEIKPEDLKTPAGRKKIGAAIDELIDASDVAQSGLHQRWSIIEDMYWQVEGSSGAKLLKDVPVRAIPLLKPRINRVTRNLSTTLMNPAPPVQALVENKKQLKADFLESGLAMMHRRSKGKNAFRQALRMAQLNGRGFKRKVLTRHGFKEDAIHARDMVVAPVYQVGIDDLDVIGHRFYKSIDWIRRQQDNGVYLDDFEASQLVYSLPGTDGHGSSDEANPSMAEVPVSATGQQQIKLYSLKVRVWEGEQYAYLSIIYAKEAKKILGYSLHPYSGHGYFSYHMDEEYGKFWFGSSTGHDLQGLQHIYTDIHNLLLTGSMISALPPILVNSDPLAEKLENYSLAEIIEVDGEVSATPLNAAFNPTVLPTMIQQVDRLVDSITAMSQNAVGQQLSGDPTATQVNRLAMIQNQSDNAQADIIGETLEREWAYMHELCRKHPDVIRNVYGRALNEEFFDALYLEVDWDSVGRASGNSPEILGQKFEQMYAMANNPRSDLKFNEVEKAIVHSMQLPVDTEQMFGRQEELKNAAETGNTEDLPIGDIENAAGGAL